MPANLQTRADPQHSDGPDQRGGRMHNFMPPTPFGRWLRQWRRAQQPPWTQARLGTAIGCSQQAISQIEKGARPGTEILVGLAEITGYAVDELLRICEREPERETDQLAAQGVPAAWLNALDRLSPLMRPVDRAAILKIARQF